MKNSINFFKTTLLAFFLIVSQIAYNQAPVWIWNSPMAVTPTTVGGAGIDVYAMIDRPGTIYYVVVLYGAGKPSIPNIMAGKDSAGNVPILALSIPIGSSDYKSGFKTIEIKPLTPNTDYDIYFVAKDTASSPHIQDNSVKLHVAATPGSAMTFWNNDFEQWNDSLTFPLYFFNQRQLLPNNQTYSRAAGESGYGIKTTVTNTSMAVNKEILIMNPDPYPFGLTGSNVKYHVSLRLKASRANAFSVTFNSWQYFINFLSNNNYGSPSPAGNAFTTIDTIKSTNWETYSFDFTMVSANRFKPRWNINKTASVQVADNIIIDNFYIKNATEAPAWWNGNPAISNVKFNKFDLTVQVDEPGLVYYVLVPKDAAAPSVSDVLAGKASGGSAAIQNGIINDSISFNTYNVTISGLSENTNYDLYLVTQNKESSPTAQGSVTKINALTMSFPGPFAKAGGSIWAISGYPVTLDGSGSIGTGLIYTWTAPGAISLSSNFASNPIFTAPSVTDTIVYQVFLVVNDGVNDSPPDTAFVHVVQDYIPIANGGGNKTVEPESNIILDGSQSTDPNGKNLIYSWSVPAAITVNKTDTSILNFVTPKPLVKTDYEFVLVVNDGNSNSIPDTVVLTVNAFNLKPSADAGNDKLVDPGTQVILDGSTSTDPNGDNLTYLWTLPSGISVSKTDTDIISFLAPSPSVKTTYKFILVVNDGEIDSDPDTLVLTVNAFNLKPSADAGNDKLVDPGTQVTLDGSTSTDPNGDSLTYLWTVPSGISVSKMDTDVISFVAPSPSLKTSYTFILVVNDGELASDPDTLVLTVNAVHVKPTAYAGDDQIVDAGTLVTLKGSYSGDSTGIPPSYSWTLPNGITVSNPDTVQISFTAPSPANTTVYPFILVVNDGIFNSDPDTVQVTVLGTVGFHAPVNYDVQLYPNPVNSILNIKLSQDWNYNPGLRIFNAIGGLILERNFTGREFQIDVNWIPSGIYFIEIRDGQKTITRKVIKK